MIIGSSSPWLMLQGMIARPRAISERTNSGVMNGGSLRQALAVGKRGFGSFSFWFAAEVFAGRDVVISWCDPGAGDSSWVIL